VFTNDPRTAASNLLPSHTPSMGLVAERRSRNIPWLRLASTGLLAVALAISVAAGRIGDSIIIGVLLAVSLAFLLVWLIAWRRGLLSEDRWLAWASVPE
jgi:hypothetical protein